MLIQEPDVLAEKLRPLLKDQVVIRYSAQHRGSLYFAAQLAVILRRHNQDYLAHAAIGASISPHTKSVDIGSGFSINGLEKHPKTIEQMCAQWSERPFDDWMHDEPFMGAYGIFLDGQPHTSVKWDASKVHWRFLTGVVVAELDKVRLPALAAVPKDEITLEAIVLMQRRFQSFAAQTELAWARRELA